MSAQLKQSYGKQGDPVNIGYADYHGDMCQLCVNEEQAASLLMFLGQMLEARYPQGVKPKLVVN